jgi:hypothetical protein
MLASVLRMNGLNGSPLSDLSTLLITLWKKMRSASSLDPKASRRAYPTATIEEEKYKVSIIQRNQGLRGHSTSLSHITINQLAAASHNDAGGL